MAYKIAGQEWIDGTTNAVDTNIPLYTLPSGKTFASTVFTITNSGAGNATIRIYVIPNSGSASKENSLAYDAVISNNGMPVAAPPGITLGTAGDEIQVRADIIGVTFQLFGDEV